MQQLFHFSKLFFVFTAKRALQGTSAVSCLVDFMAKGWRVYLAALCALLLFCSVHKEATGAVNEVFWAAESAQLVQWLWSLLNPT